jgi:hypothetical protein
LSFAEEKNFDWNVAKKVLKLSMGEELLASSS